MLTDVENPLLSEDDVHFRDVVRDFVQKEAPLDRAREWDKTKTYPYELFQSIVRQGWFGLMLPEEYGGTGGTVLNVCTVTEELSRYSSDVGGLYIVPMLVALNIDKWGTDHQKSEYLPPFLRGEIRLSFSITEPEAGSDAAALATTARKQEQGWTLNGRKVFATAADKQDNVILLAARTGTFEKRQEGISLFLVPNTLRGLTITRLPLLARRILGTTEILLEDVQLPDDALLGPLHGGWKCLGWHLALERILAACQYLGNAQGALERAREYALERVQFGRPIAKQQVIQHMLADMHVAVDAARMLTYRAAVALDRGYECQKEASMAKLFASEASLQVATAGMQILGGYAQHPDYDMERYFRDSKQSTVGGGTSQIQRTIIARAMGL